MAAATGEKEANVIGHCFGGDAAPAATLAYMTAKRDRRIKSATFFVTMVDFAEAGDLSVFIDEEQLSALEERMSKKGYLEARDMQIRDSFNMLRANDLIWSFVVNNYLLGKQPFRSTCSIGTLTRRACRPRCTASICARCTSKTCCQSRAASRSTGSRSTCAR